MGGGECLKRTEKSEEKGGGGGEPGGKRGSWTWGLQGQGLQTLEGSDPRETSKLARDRCVQLGSKESNFCHLEVRMGWKWGVGTEE